jgi:tripartite-type tricarboxylate transporter receptor subunit TctC
MKHRYAWLAALAFAGAALAPHAGRAQILQPPVRIVFPFAPGGGGDALARIMAEELKAGLNRNVVVENKTGGAGQVGVLDVVNAAPNGDTLLITPIAPVVVYPNVYKTLKYDPFNDLKPVSLIADFEFAIAVAQNVPAKTLPELVAWLKANPKQANFGSPGAGALPHFFGILFGKSIGVDMNHVAYRGSAAALVDLIAGQVPIVVTTTSDFLAAHQGGKIRILATSDAQRSPLVKDVPTFKEMGYNIEGTAWYAIFAPAKTPDETLIKYSRIFSDSLKTPAMKDRLLKLGLYAKGSTPAELGALQRQHADLWTPAVKASGFSATE